MSGSSPSARESSLKMPEGKVRFAQLSSSRASKMGPIPFRQLAIASPPATRAAALLMQDTAPVWCGMARVIDSLSGAARR